MCLLILLFFPLPTLFFTIPHLKISTKLPSCLEFPSISTIISSSDVSLSNSLVPPSFFPQSFLIPPSYMHAFALPLSILPSDLPSLLSSHALTRFLLRSKIKVHHHTTGDASSSWVHSQWHHSSVDRILSSGLRGCVHDCTWRSLSIRPSTLRNRLCFICRLHPIICRLLERLCDGITNVVEKALNDITRFQLPLLHLRW